MLVNPPFFKKLDPSDSLVNPANSTCFLPVKSCYIYLNPYVSWCNHPIFFCWNLRFQGCSKHPKYTGINSVSIEVWPANYHLLLAMFTYKTGWSSLDKFRIHWMNNGYCTLPWLQGYCHGWWLIYLGNFPRISGF